MTSVPVVKWYMVQLEKLLLAFRALNAPSERLFFHYEFIWLIRSVGKSFEEGPTVRRSFSPSPIEYIILEIVFGPYFFCV